MNRETFLHENAEIFMSNKRLSLFMAYPSSSERNACTPHEDSGQVQLLVSLENMENKGRNGVEKIGRKARKISWVK